MRKTLVFLTIFLSLNCPANLSIAQDNICVPAIEPFDYQIDNEHPLYPTARDEYQRYLQDVEAYSLCLDKERAAVYQQLKSGWEMFQKRFGKDAAFKADINEQ